MTEQTHLAAHEIELVGAWNLRRGKIAGDPISERIEWLISNHLIQLGSDSSGWSELYRAPDDDRLWELTCLTIDAARAKYRTSVDS